MQILLFDFAFKKNKPNMKKIRCKQNLSTRTRRINKKVNIIIPFRAFFRRSSITILSHIGKSTTLTRKIFWLIILIIGLIGCLSQIIYFLESYYSYGVITNLESMKPDYLPFPAVTICNINSFRREFEQCVKEIKNYHECFGLNDTDETGVSGKANITLPECIYDMRAFPNFKSSRFEWIYLLMSQKRTSRMKYGHQFEDLVRFCVYDKWSCDSSDFKMTVSHLYGNCYTFNSKVEKYLSHHSGPVNGLELELDLEFDRYSTFTQTVGARVQIHDPYLEHSIDKKGMFLSPGFETNIAVTKSIISRLPSPYKDHCK